MKLGEGNKKYLRDLRGGFTTREILMEKATFKQGLGGGGE